MSVRRPSNRTVSARLIAIAAGALLFAPQPANAFDPFEWEYVDRVEFVSILQNTRTGEYMTTVVAGGPFQSLAAARAAARRAIAEYERMMAEARREVERWRRAWDEYVASGEYARDLAEARAAWNEAMASRHTPWPEPAPDRSRRSWRRNPTVRRYFEGFDGNGDGVIDWGEIETFQQTVFETFHYRSNGRVLDPAEFMRYGGGDCDDFATFSAAFLEYHGYDAYVMVVERTGDPSSAHAVAALYLGEHTYEAGYHSIDAGPLYSGGSHGGGNYVLLDYWKVGGTIDRYDTLSHVARVDGVVGEAW
jgi:hypothetical protein